jgi:hypothetical protein
VAAGFLDGGGVQQSVITLFYVALPIAKHARTDLSSDSVHRLGKSCSAQRSRRLFGMRCPLGHDPSPRPLAGG